MYLVLLIIVIVVCALLGLIVLIQNPKGGGLTSNFSSQSQLMGVQKTGDFLEKGTWVLAIGLMVLSLVMNMTVKGGSTSIDTQYKDQVDKSLKAPVATPAATPFKAPAAPALPTQQPVKK